MTALQIRFWGTRGSLAKPGPTTIRYGGNTSCVELRTDAGDLLVLDCGTGAHELGQHLQLHAESSLAGHLLISHTHWDHIQGVPFFAPFFVPGNKWNIYAPQGFGEALRTTLAGQMEYSYFPITPEAFSAALSYHNVGEGVFRIGSTRIVTRYLNHPALTVGYRIEADGGAIVYACDHEPHARDAAMAIGDLQGQDALHSDFLRGADLVIHDAQYLAAEYPAKQGWGHSTVEYAVRACERADVRCLILTHHDPSRDDAAVDRVVAHALSFRGKPALEIVAAAEGLTREVRGSGAPALPTPVSPPVMPPSGHTVLVVTADASLLRRIAEVVEKEGLAVASAATIAAAAASYAALRPPLLILDGALTDEALAVLTGPSFGVPTLVVGGERYPSQAQNLEQISSGFSREYLRSRVRTWLMRGKFGELPTTISEAEANRLSALRSLHLLDTPPEERFDRLTRLAARLFEVPVSLITLVDEDRQWFKSKVGMDLAQTPRHMSFCTHALDEIEPLVVNDTLDDERFAENPLVVGSPHIRFYAGIPVCVAGEAVGTLCLIDTKPRALSAEELQLLKDLGSIAQTELCRTPGSETISSAQH